MRTLPLLLATGCALGPGQGFVTLDPLTLAASAPDALATDLGHAIAWDALVLEVGELALQELSGGGATFDPTNPPEGYSLCHNGHCHADDGSLPTYAEIEAALAGDAATWTPVVWADPEPVDLLDGGDGIPLRVRPSPSLPLAEIGRASLALRRLTGAGTVSGGGLAEDGPLVLDVPLEGALTASLFLAVDRDAPATVGVRFEVDLGETWLDGVDLTAGLHAYTVTVADDPLGQRVAEAILATPPSAELLQ